MRKLESISLSDVKTALRRGRDGRIENHGGWCVFVDQCGYARYVFDEEKDCQPVPFQAMRLISDEKSRRRGTLSFLSST